ncbi:MAG: MFS transporter [Pseudonocardia sediminis]
MTSGVGTEAVPEVSMGRIAVAGFIGTTIEFFDFYAYGIAAALVLNAAFFPNLDPVAGTLAAFSTYAVAFLSRPLGSALFGHWGDRIGRKSMLIASLLTMGLSTALVGALPGYATLGVFAPILLVVLRFAQGIGLGGEWGGAALLAAEHAPPGKRGLYTLFPQLGPAIGFILANGVFLGLSIGMDSATFAAWGWRIPFLASAVLVLVGLLVRLGIAESPVFRRASPSRVPLMGLLRHQPRELLLGSGAMIVQYALFYTATTYCLSYGTSILNIPRTEMLLLTMIAVIFLGLFTAASSLASDRFGRRRVVLAGCVAGIVWGLVMFPLLDTRSPVLIVVALGGALAIMGLSYGPMAAYLPELFDTRHRYSGASMAYSLGGVLGGAVPPLVATALQASLGSIAIGGFISLLAVLSLLCVLALRETRDRDLSVAG